VASLSLAGVTGQLYVDLMASAPEARKMPPVPSEKYPVIDSVRSNFDLFLSSLPDLVGRASMVLSDKNIESITKTLESIEQGAANLPDTLKDARQVVAELKATLVDVRAAAAGARQLVDTAGPNLSAASERLRTISQNLVQTTADLDKLMTDHREDLGLFLRDSLPEMERLLRDSRTAAQEFRELSRSLKADPSQLLYEPSYRGVEIPR
jgi:ABC-type transporter Mla subunit MlaD